MSQAPHSPPFRSRRRPLAACVATVFSLTAPVANSATTWLVSSCLDRGPGTLLDVVAAATTLSGDTIDLRQLPTTYGCSTISLQTGAIGITQADLTLQGPGVDQLFIFRAQYSQYIGIHSAYDRILTHTGTGNLQVNDLAVSDGYLVGGDGSTVKGGCIYSAGNVTLTCPRVIMQRDHPLHWQDRFHPSYRRCDLYAWQFDAFLQHPGAKFGRYLQHGSLWRGRHWRRRGIRRRILGNEQCDQRQQCYRGYQETSLCIRREVCFCGTARPSLAPTISGNASSYNDGGIDDAGQTPQQRRPRSRTARSPAIRQPTSLAACTCLRNRSRSGIRRSPSTLRVLRNGTYISWATSITEPDWRWQVTAMQ